MLNAADEKDADKSEHTEGLNCQTTYRSAAKGHLDRLSDGESLTGLVGCTDICIGCGPHTENTYGGTHGSTHDERDTRSFLDEEREDKSQGRNNGYDALKFGLEERNRTGTDYPGQFDHVRRTFGHLLDAVEVRHYVYHGKHAYT